MGAFVEGAVRLGRGYQIQIYAIPTERDRLWLVGSVICKHNHRGDSAAVKECATESDLKWQASKLEVAQALELVGNEWLSKEPALGVAALTLGRDSSLSEAELVNDCSQLAEAFWTAGRTEPACQLSSVVAGLAGLV